MEYSLFLGVDGTLLGVGRCFALLGLFLDRHQGVGVVWEKQIRLRGNGIVRTIACLGFQLTIVHVDICGDIVQQFFSFTRKGHDFGRDLHKPFRDGETFRAVCSNVSVDAVFFNGRGQVRQRYPYLDSVGLEMKKKPIVAGSTQKTCFFYGCADHIDCVPHDHVFKTHKYN
jgi:hypothetical protein